MDDLPSFDLSGQVALVTGAARGLGRSIALALAHAGADMALGLRSPEADGGVAAAVEAMGRRALRLDMDVTDLPASRQAIDRTVATMGRLDILVNNAGGGIGGMALDVTEADFGAVMDLNVRSAFFLSQHAAKAMIRAGRGGRIVNLSSQAALVALPGEASYCIAKAALSHMTRCLAVEWGQHGITVNAVAPTFIETPGTAAALSDPAFRADTLERIAALHRIGQPRDVSGAVVFLASPAASLVTGHTLVVDGGWTAR
ncbi:SDR family oxidoreductase [Rubellimicrobium rubrum]|uniref:SDR family oxidoreductase n=1 Tax=Rubellimicrobium rubrum TaxID=2585369 RepID=A0A5C4MRN6_9RHOB|nr:SDR family oxidoreductase [Rubellimicrobium rubrum]TNC47608.1 SDR family oxidoreductase [Rubellimicrobium rubrum]